MDHQRIEDEEEEDEREQQQHHHDNNDHNEIDDDDAQGTMTTVSRHYFGYDDETHEGAFCLDIMESMQEDYGMFIWPCSTALAEYVWQQRSRFPGRSVVEIGAGASLPGLVAAKVGADVFLTDRIDAKILDNMRRMTDMNGIHCKIMGLNWGEWDAALFDLIPDIVLGADVFYNNNDFEDLFATVTFLLRKSPQSVFITTYDNRSGHHLIEYLMVKWGWRCVKLLSAFSFMPQSKAIKLQGNIQLAEIMLDSRE